MAGIAIATGNNGTGITGVVPDGRLHYCHLPEQYSALNALSCMEEQLPDVRVFNYSSGPLMTSDGPKAQAAATHDASVLAPYVSYLSGLGDWVLVASAGNSSLSDYTVEQTFGRIVGPDRDRILVTTAAEVRDEPLDGFSNSDEDTSSLFHRLDVSAPGGASALCGSFIPTTARACVWSVDNAEVVGVTGTSYSAPMVAGAVALAWSVYPRWTPEEAAAAVRGGAFVPSQCGREDGLPRSRCVPFLDVRSTVDRALSRCFSCGGIVMGADPTFPRDFASRRLA